MGTITDEFPHDYILTTAWLLPSVLPHLLHLSTLVWPGSVSAHCFSDWTPVEATFSAPDVPTWLTLSTLNANVVYSLLNWLPRTPHTAQWCCFAHHYENHLYFFYSPCTVALWVSVRRREHGGGVETWRLYTEHLTNGPALCTCSC